MRRLLPILVVVVLGVSGGAHTVQESDADILIVGAGISGLSAALEAARGGATVLVVDMWSIFGGHAVMSTGGLSISGTEYQREQGIVDSPELHAQDLLAWGDDSDPHWAEYYANNSMTEIGDWLQALGVEWEGVWGCGGGG